MERYDMIWQPKNGTNAEHVLAVLMDDDVDVVRMILAERHPEVYDRMLKLAKGICVAIGLTPDDQPVNIVEDVYQDERGYAIRADDDFLIAMSTLWLGRDPDWPEVEFIPEFQFENHYVNVTPNDDENGGCGDE